MIENQEFSGYARLGSVDSQPLRQADLKKIFTLTFTMFATPRTRIDVKKERLNHSGIRDKLFAKYRSPSPGKKSKKKRRKKKKKKTERRSSVYGDRTSANADTFFVQGLERSHRISFGREEKAL